MEPNQHLDGLRKEIDALDATLIGLLAQRQRVVEQVLLVKMEKALPARIPERIDAVIANACLGAEKVGLNPDLARTVWSAMVEWFVQHEEQELAKHKSG